MSPSKRLDHRRGYLTETIYDGKSRRFVEQAVAHPFRSAEPSALPDLAGSTDGVARNARVDCVLAETEERMRTAHATHLGYPYNLVARSPTAASLGGFLINNLGDPTYKLHDGD